MPPTSQPNSRLMWTQSDIRGGAILRLQGILDETFDRKAMVNGLSGTVVLDLDGVTRITSFGVREWVAALRELKATEVVFVRARPAFVTQFNTVAAFAGPGRLVTFFAPYICEECSETQDLLVDMRTDSGWVKRREPPELRCPKCHNPMEFDDEPGVYFLHASRAPAANLSPVASALVNGTELPAPHLRVEKEVEDRVTALWLSGSLEQAGPLQRVIGGLEGDVVAIFREVEDTTPDNLKRLFDMLGTIPAPVYLTRVPLEVVTAKPHEQKPNNLRVVSLTLSCTCPACGRTKHLEFTSPKTLLGEGTERCSLDGQLLVPDLPLVDRQQLLKVMTSAPATVARYLIEHPTPTRGAFADGVTPSQGTPTPGAEHLFGRYELLRQLGRGGMAEVHLARQLSVGGFSKTVVLKRILPHLSGDHAFVQMFLQEARLAARISHPNVVEIFDVGQVGNRYFIAMEYVRGVDLAQLLQVATKLNEPMPLELAARVVCDVAAGLHAAHSSVAENGMPAPIIHRDVSPHNVLLGHDGQVKLTDFGIAKAADSAQMTPANAIKGKITYLAPEQIRASIGTADTRVDIFPLGLTLYQCATLEQMFRRDTEYATMWALLNDPIKKLSSKLPTAPALADQVLTKCLARDPRQRYQTALEVQQDLERLLASLPGDSSHERLSQWIRFIDDEAKTKNAGPGVLEPTPSAEKRSVADDATRTVHKAKPSE